MFCVMTVCRVVTVCPIPSQIEDKTRREDAELRAEQGELQRQKEADQREVERLQKELSRMQFNARGANQVQAGTSGHVLMRAVSCQLYCDCDMLKLYHVEQTRLLCIGVLSLMRCVCSSVCSTAITARPADWPGEQSWLN